MGMNVADVCNLLEKVNAAENSRMDDQNHLVPMNKRIPHKRAVELIRQRTARIDQDKAVVRAIGLTNMWSGF